MGGEAACVAAAEGGMPKLKVMAGTGSALPPTNTRTWLR